MNLLTVDHITKVFTEREVFRDAQGFCEAE